MQVARLTYLAIAEAIANIEEVVSRHYNISMQEHVSTFAWSLHDAILLKIVFQVFLVVRQN